MSHGETAQLDGTEVQSRVEHAVDGVRQTVQQRSQLLRPLLHLPRRGARRRLIVPSILGFGAAFEERRELVHGLVHGVHLAGVAVGEDGELASEHVEGLRPREVTGDEEGEGAGIVHGVHLAGVGIGEDGELGGKRVEGLRPREVAGDEEGEGAGIELLVAEDGGRGRRGERRDRVDGEEDAEAPASRDAGGDGVAGVEERDARIEVGGDGGRRGAPLAGGGGERGRDVLERGHEEVGQTQQRRERGGWQGQHAPEARSEGGVEAGDHPPVPRASAPRTELTKLGVVLCRSLCSAGAARDALRLLFTSRFRCWLCASHEPWQWQRRREERYDAGAATEPVAAGDDGCGRRPRPRRQRVVLAELLRVVGWQPRKQVADGDRGLHAVPRVLHGGEGLPHLHQLQAALPRGPPPAGGAGASLDGEKKRGRRK